MSYHYSNPDREAESGALPDVEVFHTNVLVEGFYDPETNWVKMPDMGYYYAYGFPGCLWDSDPVGPFDTEVEALTAAREGVEE